MASSFKILEDRDQVVTRTNIHESVPLTGTIISGTYNDENIKNYGNGTRQSVYDYPYLSSSANRIFDISQGYSSDSDLSSSANVQNSKKINIYTSMAKQFVGHDDTGSILNFDQDGNILAGGNKLKEVFFLNFNRLLYKDEIKKGTFTISLLAEGPGTPGGADTGTELTIGDYNADSDFRVNSPAGEYGILYTSSATPNSNSGVGLLYYHGGLAVLTSSLFYNSANGDIHPSNNFWNDGTTSGTVDAIITGSNIEEFCDGLRNRITNIAFNNTTEVYSKIYYCRINHNEFNYSSNPTYLSSSKIVVKNTKTDEPVSYITGIGLYSADNVLLAVAKLSEPLRNSNEADFSLRVRLDS